MGYTHYYPQKKDVPTPQWNTLCEKIAEVFNWLQTAEIPSYYRDEPITICDGRGEIVFTEPGQLFQIYERRKVISFNGDASKGHDHETFFLSKKKVEDFQFCKTACKPYDWFVVSVLILMHNICPGCFDISSDGDAQDWTPVLKWLQQRSRIEYMMPMAVISDVFSK